MLRCYNTPAITTCRTYMWLLQVCFNSSTYVCSCFKYENTLNPEMFTAGKVLRIQVQNSFCATKICISSSSS